VASNLEREEEERRKNVFSTCIATISLTDGAPNDLRRASVASLPWRGRGGSIPPRRSRLARFGLKKNKKKSSAITFAVSRDGKHRGRGTRRGSSRQACPVSHRSKVNRGGGSNVEFEGRATTISNSQGAGKQSDDVGMQLPSGQGGGGKEREKKRKEVSKTRSGAPPRSRR